jgi:hypothetical protein
LMSHASVCLAAAIPDFACRISDHCGKFDVKCRGIDLVPRIGRKFNA